MSIITLDFETPYSKEYSLKKLTYEMYIYNELFEPHGVGIKIGENPTEYHYKDIKGALTDLFPPGNTHTIIAHNTMFDGAVLSWYYGLQAHRYYCTERISRALWHQYSASLENLALRLFPDDEHVRKGDELKDFEGKFELTDEEQQKLGKYCKNDVDVTFMCFRKMWKYMPEEELDVLDLTLKMFVHPAFILDRPAAQKYLKKIEQETNDKIQASGLSRKLLASNDQFAAWILGKGIPFEKIKSPTPKNPDNTKWPLAKTAPEFIKLQTDYPQYDLVWDARLAVKSAQERTRARRLLEHSSPNALNREGRIAMPLNYAAAHTLRWGGTNKVNPQNFGRNSLLRPALLAPPGYRVLVGDSSNIEVRMLAWLAGAMSLLEMFRDKVDVYCEFATDIFSRPITKADERERFIGKTGVLGLGYQTGGNKLQRTFATGTPRVHITLAEAKRIVRLFRNKFPEIPNLWYEAECWIQRMCITKHKKVSPYTYKCLEIERGRILSPVGMYLNYPEIREEEAQTTYNNGKFRTSIYGGKLVENVIQHLARCVLRDHMLKVQAYLQPLGGRVVLQIHDEIVSIVPEEFAFVCQEHILGIMRTPPAWCDDGTLVLDAEGVVAHNYGKH